MKRILSTMIAIALLLGLGALAVLARGGGAVLSPARAVPVALAAPGAQDDTNAPVAVPDTQSEGAAPDAVATGVNKLNNISIPLGVQNQFTSKGLPFTAFGLAKFIGRPMTDVAQVWSWNATSQAYTKCLLLTNKCSNINNDFPLQLNGNYMLFLTSALTQTVASFVGDVPDSASVHFNMAGTTSPCKLNAITLPLHKASVTNAVQLAAELGGFSVVQELRAWNVAAQAFTKCTVLPNGNCSNMNNNFPTTIGYPYWVCLKSPKVWP